MRNLLVIDRDIFERVSDCSHFFASLEKFFLYNLSHTHSHTQYFLIKMFLLPSHPLTSSNKSPPPKSRSDFHARESGVCALPTAFNWGCLHEHGKGLLAGVGAMHQRLHHQRL